MRDVPIAQPEFWDDLGRLIIETEAQPHHFLLPRRKAIPKGQAEIRRSVTYLFPDQPMGGHGLHSWWYRCLERAGIVAAGTSSGERMHEARHTAGQRVLDVTGNLKAAQKLLGHASISTTADVYTDWDLDQLAETMREVVEENERIVPPGD
jgi:integrase